MSEELLIRENRRIKMGLNTARLMPPKTLESFDFAFQPSLEKPRIDALASLGFIERKEVVHFLGPPGTGKSHLACALGVTAVKAGRSVYRTTLADLIGNLAKAHHGGLLNQKLRQMSRHALLIVDEIGYLPLPKEGANLFFQLVSARYEKGAMILTSNRSFAESKCSGIRSGQPSAASRHRIEGASYRPHIPTCCSTAAPVGLFVAVKKGGLGNPKVGFLRNKPADDLVGKKILAQGVAERTAIDATLAINNLPKEWEFVPAGFSPEPLLAKQGDGYTAFGTNQAVALELLGMKRGEDFHFASFDSLGFKQYASAVFTSREYLQNNRSTMVKFLRALTRGWQANEEDPTAAPNLAVNKFGADLGLNIEQQLRQNELQMGMMRNPDKPEQPILLLDQDSMEKMYVAAKATGRENIPPIEKLADFSVMEEVYQSLE